MFMQIFCLFHFLCFSCKYSLYMWVKPSLRYITCTCVLKFFSIIHLELMFVYGVWYRFLLMLLHMSSQLLFQKHFFIVVSRVVSIFRLPRSPTSPIPTSQLQTYPFWLLHPSFIHVPWWPLPYFPPLSFFPFPSSTVNYSSPFIEKIVLSEWVALVALSKIKQLYIC